jgi:two-component system, LytTR family, response regulator LytT
MINTLIVEDEVFAREELKHQISIYEDLNVIDECLDGINAIKKIQELKPDLIFLDIEMPGMKGVEVLDIVSSMENYAPLIIVITAYENYAIKAFEYNVVDYLLKPINTKRFAEAINRVKTYMKYKTNKIKRIVAKRGSRIILIEQSDISFISLEDSIVCVHSKSNKYFTNYRTLEEIEKELIDGNFFRVHRSYIVNLDKVLELKQGNSGNLLLKLKDFQDETVPVSRSKSKDIKAIFNL